MNLNAEIGQENERYLQMIALMGKLSNLFAETEIPYIHYRVTENLFCKYCNAENLSRTDTAYDAKIGSLGIGIKTFQLKNDRYNNDYSVEKIAEFNSLHSELKNFSGTELARKLAHYRNERIQVANRLYNITDSIYHIVGRKENSVCIFNSPYELIDESRIKKVVDNNKSLRFEDGLNEYSFNYSKSVLMKRFIVPPSNKIIPIEIIQDPYLLLEQLISGITASRNIETKYGLNYVTLPLYSTRDNEVQPRAGLNQWNAAGRKRHEDEVYISIPASIHKYYPDFFPPRHTSFELLLPDGKTALSVKVCQTNGKGLMSAPNKALGEWILRKVINIEPGRLLTLEKLNEVGFDSVIITKHGRLSFSIDVMRGQKYNE